MSKRNEPGEHFIVVRTKDDKHAKDFSIGSPVGINSAESYPNRGKALTGRVVYVEKVPTKEYVISADEVVEKLHPKGFRTRRAKKAYRLQINFGKHVDFITSFEIKDYILPVVSAIEVLQSSIGGNKKKEQIRVLGITQNSPIEISMLGIPEAYKAIREDIIPWRRMHQKSISEIERKEKEAIISKMQAEISLSNATSEIQRAEAKKIMLDVKKAEVELEKIKFELNREKIVFLYNLIKKSSPDISEVDVLEKASKLLPLLDNLMTGPASFQE